jgi:hypothetical protein
MGRIQGVEIRQQAFQMGREIRIAPQIVKDVLAVGNDGRVGAEMEEDLTDGGPTQSAVGEGSKGALQFQVTHALGV